MSQTKGVEIFERFVWVWDNAHDIVVARMVEAAQRLTGIGAAWIDEWRLVASISDHALALASCSGTERAALGIVLSSARRAFGYRSFENFRTVVLFRCGGLDLYPSTHLKAG